ncbi:MAG: methionyl-tRNA formyltransferase [Candidatus Marinimicrobia bacterium]|nr:methionyl-tRNA formyltransferase [Candidatus Neomarinimicrobiota bacterium]
MKVVFFGNADFGIKALEAICESKEHEVLAVVTNEDKKYGRRQNLKSTPIKDFAIKRNLRLIEKDKINDNFFINKLKKIKADIYVVVAYKILPKKIYSIPDYGAVNIHASILPSYKGAAPIQRAIINNESSSGLSSFFINERVDSGELINQKKVDVNKNDSFGDLWTKLFLKSGLFMLETLELVLAGKNNLIEFSSSVESFAPKISKNELKINWEEQSLLIHNKIRAFSPYPCMHTYFKAVRVKIIKSSIEGLSSSGFSDAYKRNPGQLYVHEKKLFVFCGSGVIRIISLKLESKKNISSIEFINGYLGGNPKHKYEFK